MYVDEKILTIIFKAKGDEDKIKEILEDYYDRLGDLTFKIYKKYFTDPNIEKPALRGMQEMADLDTENIDMTVPENQERVNTVMGRAFMAAATTPEFITMYAKAMNKFHEFLVEDSIGDLEEEELDELIEYMEQLKENLHENVKKVQDVLKESTDTILNKQITQ